VAFRHGFLRGYVAMDITDAVFVLAAVALWTHMRLHITDGFDESVSVGPGYVLLWLSLVTKLVVTKKLAMTVIVKPAVACCHCLGMTDRSRQGRRGRTPFDVADNALDRANTGILRGTFGAMGELLDWSARRH
jgi:hypothetical protein